MNAADVTYLPELAEHDPEIDQMIRMKGEWIGRNGATHDERLQRFQRIRDLSARLRPAVQVPIDHVQG